MTKATKISYAAIATVLLLVCVFHLSTLIITVLFSYFALDCLRIGGRKGPAVGLFLLLVTALGVGFYFFAHQALVAFPKIADTTIPVVAEHANRYGLELPFTDFESLRTLVFGKIPSRVAGLGHYAHVAAVQLMQLLIGLAAAVSLFLDARFQLGADASAVKDNIYLLVWIELSTRFRTFYASFRTVMGAQIIISLINTALTAGFLLWQQLPYASVIIVCTFLCGLLPIIGNILSNSLIVCIALTVSPKLAIAALVFLVVLHKLEYFLNSKVVGDRIKNPMWLTLLGLIIGETLLGIPGMILAPVVFYYVKVEASHETFSRPSAAG